MSGAINKKYAHLKLRFVNTEYKYVIFREQNEFLSRKDGSLSKKVGSDLK